MKNRTLCTILLLATAPSVLGQVGATPASDASAGRDDILKLFDVMQVRTQMNAVMTQIMIQTRTMTHEQMRKRNPGITDADLAKADAMSEQLIKEMPIDGMLDDMIPVYQKHLNKADVEAMIAFYSTPTGQKILHELPAMATEGLQALQPRLRKQMDETMEKVEEMSKPNTKPAPKP